VDGEFIGDCNSFFDYIKNSYGYQIHIEDDILEDIAEEDIKIQNYLSTNIPIVSNTNGIPYFKDIPHLSETYNNVPMEYTKKNNKHCTLKKLRHRLNNTIDEVKYEDFINKNYFNNDIRSRSVSSTNLEIDSVDLNDYDNNSTDYEYDDDNEKDNIRVPEPRYHKFMDNHRNTHDTSSTSQESLITPMNSKYTPSTKPQSKANPLNQEEEEGEKEEQEQEIILDSPDYSKPNDDEDKINDDQNIDEEEDEMYYTYNNQNDIEEEDKNDQLNEVEDDIDEQINNEEEEEEEEEEENNDIPANENNDKEEIIENIKAEDNTEVVSPPDIEDQNSLKVVSSSNSNNILPLLS